MGKRHLIYVLVLVGLVIAIWGLHAWFAAGGAVS